MEMQSIFGNTEQIYEISKKFCKSLEEEITSHKDPSSKPLIGKVFLDHVRHMLLYFKISQANVTFFSITNIKLPLQMDAFQAYEAVCTHQQISTDWLDMALGKKEQKEKEKEKGKEKTDFAIFCEVRPPTCLVHRVFCP